VDVTVNGALATCAHGHEFRYKPQDHLRDALRMARHDIETKSSPDLDHFVTKMQIKSISEAGEIEGYGSVFGQVDSVNDIVAKGAFKDSLERHRSEGTNVKMLWQHDPERPCGIWDEVTEDERGLKVKGRFMLGTTMGREAHIMAKEKVVDGMSIGFRTKRYEYQTDAEIRVLNEVDLWEVSLVTFPALRSARVTAVKSDLTERRVEEILRDVGFSRAQAKSMTGAWKSTVPAHRDDAGQEKDLTDANSSLRRLLATMTS